MTGKAGPRTRERDEIYVPLAELVARLDKRKIADLPWVGSALIIGLLENV